MTRILKASRLFIVLYKGEPFVQTNSRRVEGIRPDYRRTSYPTRKSAEARAKVLNELFDCTDFTVAEVVFG